MGYFVCVGEIAANDGGQGARGYHLRREGTVVHMQWGPIEVRRKGNGVRYLWRGGKPDKSVTERRRSPRAAAERYLEKRRELLRPRTNSRPAYCFVPRIFQR